MVTEKDGSETEIEMEFTVRKLKRIRKNFKPEIAAQLTEDGQRRLAYFLFQACEWGAGNALAGLILRKIPTENYQILEGVLKKLGCRLEGTLRKSTWRDMVNLEIMAQTLLNPELAQELIDGAKMGTGFQRVTGRVSVSLPSSSHIMKKEAEAKMGRSN